MRKKKLLKKRTRGGASHPCPKCSGPTHVLTTRREGENVVRRRQCRWCEHPFVTREKHLPHVEAVVR